MRKTLTLLVIFFITFFSFNILNAEPKKGVVNDKIKTRLRVRKKPSKKSEVKAYLYKGNEVSIRKKKGKWNKIVSGNIKGWVRSKYITVTEENTVQNPSQSEQKEHNLLQTSNEAKVKSKNDLTVPTNQTLLNIQMGTPLN